MAIDTSETRNSLFGSVKKAAKSVSSAEESTLSKEDSQESSLEAKKTNKHERPEEQAKNAPGVENQPKWQTFDKVTTLLTSEQKEGLDRVAKKIMKFRSKQLKGNDNKERITTNTLIRVLIDIFLQREQKHDFQEVVSSEDDVREWVRKLFT